MNNNRPLIGMLREFKRANKLVTAAAIEAEKLNCNFIFFHPDDIDFESKTVEGQIYMNQKWEKKTLRFPDVVDNPLGTKKYRDIYIRLEEIIPFTSTKIGSKDIVANRIKEQKMFANMVIPYEMCSNSDQIMEYLQKHGRIIIKPKSGRNGKGILFIMKYENEYIIHNQMEARTMNYDQLLLELDQLPLKNRIMQPYIDSITKEGNPFDIRLHMRRGAQGEWQLVKMYSRVGKSGSVTSNGGIRTDLNDVLVEKFSNEKAIEIEAELKAFASLFPEKFQKYYEKALDALGIDLVVNEVGKLFILDINTFLKSIGFESESQSLAMAYAMHLVKGTNNLQKEISLNDGAGPTALYRRKPNIAMFSLSPRLDELKIACAAISSLEGYNFFYFTPHDMDFKTKTVNGYYYTDGNWKQKKYNYLKDIDIIYDRVRHKGVKKYQSYYKELSFLEFTHKNFSIPVNKLKVTERFQKYRSIENWLIPTSDYNFEKLCEYIRKYNDVIIKPQHGSFGKGLYLIEKREQRLIISSKHTEEFIDIGCLEEWLDKTIAGKPYIIQPYIYSRTKERSPSDVRVHMVRNGKGEWTFLEIYPRIGVEYEKITPMTQGGYRGRWKGFE